MKFMNTRIKENITTVRYKYKLIILQIGSIDFADVDRSIRKVSTHFLRAAKFKLKLSVVFFEPFFLWVFKKSQ